MGELVVRCCTLYAVRCRALHTEGRSEKAYAYEYMSVSASCMRANDRMLMMMKSHLLAVTHMRADRARGTERMQGQRTEVRRVAHAQTHHNTRLVPL